MRPSGYSGTPLAKKLGIRAGFKVRLFNQPVHYFDLFTDMPDGVFFSDEKRSKKNFIHFFTKSEKELEKNIAALRTEIEQDGMIWVSWPKKASKIETDITEDAIRHLALSNGLVDIKVCAVDEVWSGLKLVIPIKDRTKV